MMEIHANSIDMYLGRRHGSVVTNVSNVEGWKIERTLESFSEIASVTPVTSGVVACLGSDFVDFSKY